MSLITLTTDFGLDDWFVGTMKGVIHSLHPRATIVDISHAIPPGDIRAGAFALLQAAPFFPKDTIHVAVVDPGVGGNRQAIAIQTRQAVFLGPDNGLLSFAIRNQPIRAVRRLANPRLFLHRISRTFHGRDVFAPVAAQLARGLPFSRIGPRISEFHQLTWSEPEVRLEAIRGRIVYIDRFGNAITNVPAAILITSGRLPGSTAISIGRRHRIPLVDSYSAVPVGQALGVMGSTGFLEIAINRGAADQQLGLEVDDQVTVRPWPKPASRKPLDRLVRQVPSRSGP